MPVLQQRSFSVVLVVAVVVLLVPGDAFAQNGTDVSGRVVDAETSEGLAACLVAEPLDGGEPATATADANGAYVFSDLPSGDWIISAAECDGETYAREYYDNAGSEASADPVTVGGQAVTDIDFDLERAGWVTGLLTDTDHGHALRDICVDLLDATSATYPHVATQVTPGNGTYRFAARPGEYLVYFRPCGNQSYVGEYYADGPEATEPGDATTVVLVAEQEITADEDLTRAGSLGGTVTAGHTFEALGSICIEAWQVANNGPEPDATAVSAADGTFTLNGLKEGDYHIGYNTCDAADPDFDSTWYNQDPTRDTANPIAIEAGDHGGFVDAFIAPIVDLTVACPAGEVPPSRFPDVTSGTHAFAIRCMSWEEWDIARGGSDGRYHPTMSVRRDQMASFVARALEAVGVPLPAQPPDAFRDDDGNTHQHAINQLAALEIVSGKGEGRYDPGALVTRGQMAKFLANAYKVARNGTALTAQTERGSFTDIQDSTFYFDILRVFGAKLASGRTETTYAPNDPVRRDQMATFLARLVDLLSREIS